MSVNPTKPVDPALQVPPTIAQASTHSVISATWQLIQGRLWPLIDEAVFQNDNFYKPTSTFTVAWPGQIIVSTDSEQDKEILKYPRYSENITGGFGWDTFARICFGYDNLIMTKGKQHAKLLKVLKPLFAKTSVRDRYYIDLKAVTRMTLTNWGSEEGGIFVWDAALEHSCRSVTTCFLGKEAAESPQIVKAVKNLMGIFWDNAQMKPSAVINLLFRKIFGRCCNLDGYWDNHQILIDAIEKASMSAPSDSFVGRLMGEEITKQELIDNMKMLYFAGTDTTGSLITTALGYLAIHENEQLKLREELDGRNIDDLSYEALHDLKTFKACIYESLRLVPPIPLQVRDVNTGTEKYSYFIDHFHRLRDAGRMGVNPDEFNPSRFMEDESLYLEAEKVFGAGLTPCIGKHFALTETLLLLVYIVSDTSLTIVENGPIEIVKEAGAHLSPNLKIKVHLKTD